MDGQSNGSVGETGQGVEVKREGETPHTILAGGALSLDTVATELRRVLGLIESEQERRKTVDQSVAREVNLLGGMLARINPGILSTGVVPPSPPPPASPVKRSTRKAKPVRKSTGPSPSSIRKMQAQRRAVSSGARPALAVAAATVMGDETLSITEIEERLRKRGWLPHAKDVGARIGTALGNETYFKRVERGVYKATAKGRARRLVEKVAKGPVKRSRSQAEALMN